MRNPKFNEILKEIGNLHDQKNTDYATAEDPLKNLKGCERLNLPPVTGTFIRMQDKIERIENYFRNGNLVNESVRDAFIDLGVYALMGVLILDEMEDNGKQQEENIAYKTLRND